MGDEVPDFRADSTVGTFGYHDMVDGVWSVLVTFPAQFDAVATTEIGQLSKLREEFDARNARVVGLSCTTKQSQRSWIEEIEEIEDCRVNFPLVADADATIARRLGLVRHGATGPANDALIPATLVLIADIDRRIRLSMHYPATSGRNFYEVLRALDTLQLTLFHQVATPAHWIYGEDVIVQPKLSNVAARAIFPKGLVESKPWFRTTPQPDT